MDQHRPDEPGRGNSGEGKPTPEQLAAFVDGEGSPAARRAVEDWLASHPEDLAFVESLRDLDQVWHDTAPPEPSEEVWAPVLARIEGGVSAPARRGRHLAGLVWISLALGATAATLAISIGLTRTPPEGTQPTTPEVARRALPFATEDGAIVMASARDVIVHQSSPGLEVIMPDQKDQGSPAWPLVMVTADASREP
jgi:anti-sigma factor RsiW